ncbi:MAG: hypothetical protein GY926_02985 [bacterium]|nr:hypothetical protein [bacterium]
MRYASRVEMLKAFGPFAEVFETTGEDPNPYLSLLRLEGDVSTATVDRIRAAIECEDSHRAILVLLQDDNWRPHLVGAVAMAISPSPKAITETWRTLDAGSWVTPQMAAALSLVDSSFRERAIDRLNRGCPLLDLPTFKFRSVIEQHSAQGPSGSKARSAKAAASLFALVEFDQPDDPAIVALRRDSDVQDLIRSDTSRDVVYE